jgi:hypothetical protein
MAIITDEYFKERHSKLKEYTMVLLKPTERTKEKGIESLIMEHARNNMALQEDGLLSIVCPVSGNYDISGLYIFNVPLDEVRKIMDGDPAVAAGIFQYDIYPCKGFSGDTLA